LKDKASDLKDKAQDAASNFKDKASDLKDRATDSLKNSYATARDATLNAEEDVIEYVRANPVKSIGIALLTGFALSFLKRK
jgi:ElaB/YqjD/DUF883 family membrane-anchored ribosome-binding protein